MALWVYFIKHEAQEGFVIVLPGSLRFEAAAVMQPSIMAQDG